MGCCNNTIPKCGENPCRVTQTNTPACESLPSQIQNFTDQFFGLVVKTEVDGNIVWSLPCNLDVGLPNNPRAAGEGLACYFLRLFEDGIVGLTGPPGSPGNPGADGRNAFTVTLQAFTQPTPDNPNIQILTAYNPSILVGLFVAIDTSGWYQVVATDVSGALFLTLHTAFSGAPAVITAGKLVVPAGNPGPQGTPGQSIVGPQGIPGPPGTAFSATNGFFFTDVGSDYSVGVVYASVDFVNAAPQVLLPAAGVYLLTAVIDINGLAGIVSNNISDFKLQDTTVNGIVPGSEHSISGMVQDERRQVVLNAIYSSIGPSQIELFAKASSANVFSVAALRTTVSFVRLS